MRRIAAVVLTLLIATLGMVAQNQQTAAPAGRDVRKGELISTMRSQGKPDQSYALYLPSAYTSERQWPIVYVFDPGARGERPLQLMKEAAERYGFILAASNNSRNGPVQPQVDAANAMWTDTHTYLSIDDRRVYFAGFSGGARVASYVAQLCKCSHAVFLNGAALMPTVAPSISQNKLSAFSIAGRGDFNYGELLDLDSKLDSLAQPHFFRRFDGEHSWAPAPVWDEAFVWATVLEMKENLRPRDPTFISGELAKSTDRARKQVEAGEPSFALQETRALIALYDGLTDATALMEQAATLAKEPLTNKRLKEEKSELERQQSLANDVLETVASLDKATSVQRSQIATEAASRLRAFREQFTKEKNPSTRRVLQRVLGSVFAFVIGSGGPLIENGDYANAEAYWVIASEARPDWNWAHLSLAQCHAARGDKKAAIRDLKRAVEEANLSAKSLADFVAKTPKLGVIAETEDYKKLLATAERNSPQPAAAR